MTSDIHVPGTACAHRMRREREKEKKARANTSSQHVHSNTISIYTASTKLQVLGWCLVLTHSSCLVLEWVIIAGEEAQRTECLPDKPSTLFGPQHCTCAGMCWWGWGTWSTPAQANFAGFLLLFCIFVLSEDAFYGRQGITYLENAWSRLNFEQQKKVCQDSLRTDSTKVTGFLRM